MLQLLLLNSQITSAHSAAGMLNKPCHCWKKTTLTPVAFSMSLKTSPSHHCTLSPTGSMRRLCV